jgi:hypothetical protein
MALWMWDAAQVLILAALVSSVSAQAIAGLALFRRTRRHFRLSRSQTFPYSAFWRVRRFRLLLVLYYGMPPLSLLLFVSLLVVAGQAPERYP